MTFRKTKWEGVDGDRFLNKQLQIMGTHFSTYHIMTHLYLSSEIFLAKLRTVKTTYDYNEEQIEPVINTCLNQYKLNNYVCKSDLTSNKCTFCPQKVVRACFLYSLLTAAIFFCIKYKLTGLSIATKFAIVKHKINTGLFISPSGICDPAAQ
jgi:hypothetical protein